MSGASYMLLIPLLLLHLCAGEEEGAGASVVRLGPWFEAEPPSLVEYAAARGVRVRCAARGHPPPLVEWLSAGSGAPLVDEPHLRRVYSNGTLELAPVSAVSAEEGARGSFTVRCRAANPHGVALSRDVTLVAAGGGDGGAWTVEASAAPAAATGVAVLGCTPSPADPRVLPALWYRQHTLIHLDRPHPGSRYVSAGSVLLIRNVSAADAGAYSCVARHSLTALTRRSPPASLTVTESSGAGAPRPAGGAGVGTLVRTVRVGEHFCLPCAASDHLHPHYTWYREWEGRLRAVEGSGEGSEGAWAWAGGAALCVRAAARSHVGIWLCKAYNAYGDATAQHRVDILDELFVTVTPVVLVASAGSTVRFRCAASDARAALSWLHEGTVAAAGAELVLRGVARHHRGVYQCFARRTRDSAQAAAELQLGDSSPELVYTFIEQALRAGGSVGVSLRCAAAGSPPPRFTWLLDDAPLDTYRAPHRYSINEESVPSGDVVSTLNITSVTSSDGGRYTCRAASALGAADHSARLNIYGPPSIRALPPVRVVAGDNATVNCPYAGYPISSISWWRRGASVALSGEGRVATRGATLHLTPALLADAGHYACAVAAPAGPAARQDFEIQVRNPPKISPFMFSSDLTEGSSVQVLCGVSSGDKPMYFSWLKDGAPLPSSLQIEEKSLNEFSLLMFSELSARHSGAYTCRVANHASAVNYTATLTVNVAPAWTTEPLDVVVLLGAPLLLECAATGYPAPLLTWYRRIGDGNGVSGESERWEVVGDSGAWSVAGGMRASNGSLAAVGASRTHQGIYRCSADNGVGLSLLKHVNVTVHEAAHFDTSGGNVSCVLGRSVTMTCIALGDPPLAVHWTHRGRRLDLDSYRWSVSEANADGGLRSTLTLRMAERDDGGMYQCHARNRHGSAEHALHLIVEEPPAAPRLLRLAGVGAHWVRLTWGALPAAGLRYTALCTPLNTLPGDGPRQAAINFTLDINSVTDEGPDKIAGWVSACVVALRPAATYSLRLIATNYVGHSPYSDPLVFTTLEEVPAAAPQNVQVRPVGSVELHVSWLVPLQESWNGELLGYVVTWRELSGAADTGGASGGRETAPGWSVTELTVGGLRAASSYALAVRAYNTAGAGPPSPLVYATTADGVPEAPPSSVTCDGVTATSLRVRWSSAHGDKLLGYDIHYTPLEISSAVEGGKGVASRVRAGAGGKAALQGLMPATNYSVWMRARADAGLGPPSAPVYCATAEDVPGVVSTVRALAAGADAVRVTWLAPEHRNARITHYMLYSRELGKDGAGEWSQRVETNGADEVWREVRGLRPAVYEMRVLAAAARGSGPPSRPVTAAPALPVSARISSFARAVVATLGSRVRLPCAAVGAPPLRRRWSPLPAAHTLTDAGDLLLHKVSAQYNGNYTCSVRNAGGADAVLYTLTVVGPPRAPPAPRLVRASRRTLHLTWDAPPESGAPILGYTVEWSQAKVNSESAGGEEIAGRARVPAVYTGLSVARLTCGSRYAVTLVAHNIAGDSQRSPPLMARTAGDKATSAPGKEFVWTNSSSLRLNLLTWRVRCPVATWSVTMRATGGGSAPWRDLPADGESASAAGLAAATWYEVRVLARSSAGDTTALYRVPTRALSGERIGEATEVTAEARRSAADAAGKGGSSTNPRSNGWRSSAAMLGGGVAALLVALGSVAAARRNSACLRRESAPRCVGSPPALHHQLYSTEPSKRNGKASTPPDGELEISPYATFSMSEGAVVAEGCALHLHSFGRAEGSELSAPPPPRPNLLTHSATDYERERERGRSSDSESSGSPCAACADHLSGAPAPPRARAPRPRPRRPDTLGVESSVEDTTASCNGGAGASGRGARHCVTSRAGADWREHAERVQRDARHGERRGRRVVARHAHSSPQQSTVRYSIDAERQNLAL